MDTRSGRIGDGDSTSEKKQPTRIQTPSVQGVLKQHSILLTNKEADFLPDLKDEVSSPKNLIRRKILILIVVISTLIVSQSTGTDNMLNRCDVNRDGIINIQDLIIISNNFGKTSDYPMHHIHKVGDRVRGFVRRINDNPDNSFIGLSYTTSETLNTEFKFYVPASTWKIEGLVALLHRLANIDVRITNLRSDGTYDATLISGIAQ